MKRRLALSVITTIEKRFDIPSKMTGMIASTFELGNLPTVLFVSYFGTHRHIPVWIAKGAVITGVGSLLFAVPHFLDINNPLDKVRKCQASSTIKKGHKRIKKSYLVIRNGLIHSCSFNVSVM